VKDVGKRLLEIKQSQVQNYFNNNFYFQEHFYLFNYESEIREKIIQYKFQDKSYLYKTFAKLFITDENFAKFIRNYDCITSVPLHKKRFKSRGYNQSELIAKEIANYFNIPYFSNILIKQKNIVAQSTLNKENRQLNITNAFSINPQFISNTMPDNILPKAKIAVFDDIFTTGATANECAKTLFSLGTSKIRYYNYC